MNLAQDAWKAGNVPRLLELLNQHRPPEGEEDLRGFDWRYLWHQANGQRQTIPLPSPSDFPTNPFAFAVSPDGRWIAVANNHPGNVAEDSSLSSIRLWDVATGSLRHTIVGRYDPDRAFPEPDRMYHQMVFSGDGTLFATVTLDDAWLSRPPTSRASPSGTCGTRGSPSGT